MFHSRNVLLWLALISMGSSGLGCCSCCNQVCGVLHETTAGVPWKFFYCPPRCSPERIAPVYQLPAKCRGNCCPADYPPADPGCHRHANGIECIPEGEPHSGESGEGNGISVSSPNGEIHPGPAVESVGEPLQPAEQIP